MPDPAAVPPPVPVCAPPAAAPTPARLAALSLAAVGVVYGDIGTSPLYALRACFGPALGVAPTPANVLGVTSLVIWALLLVVSLKYVGLVLRADNRGEGGILALLALALRAVGPRASAGLLMALGLTGAGLFFGDGMITPAMSVLSAVEGLEVESPAFASVVLPLTLLILVGLFMLQSRGSERVGRLFGPVMVVWFVVIGLLGAVQIAQQPTIVAAFDPRLGVMFLIHHGWAAFAVLGAVVLVVTGAEALYADIGHFGRTAIRLVWSLLVLPALLLNYLGQAALLLDNPGAAENPFFLLVPDWAVLPMVLLAMAATVIASQAVISGVFSLSRQAMQLGYSPRLAIRHTSDEEEGQVYVPRANWWLLTGVIVLVVGFGSSNALVSAYGVAVTGTMVATTVLVMVVARLSWGWPLALCLGLGAVILAVDLTFFVSNLLKVGSGGWFPLVVGAGMLLLMGTWRKGRAILSRRLAEGALTLDQFIAQQKDSKGVIRVGGTAVYMTSASNVVPLALLHNLKHNRALHRRIVFLTVLVEDIPRVHGRDRIEVVALADGFYRLILRYGFVQEPDVPKALRLCKALGLDFDLMDTSFFLGHENIVSGDQHEMPEWRERLFVVMSRSAVSATEFFRIPPGRVVELGAQIRL
ncbi:MAG: potassium transport protein Kup [Pseudomonadota bacterium]